MAVGIRDNRSPSFELVDSPEQVGNGASQAGDLVRLLEALLLEVTDPLLEGQLVMVQHVLFFVRRLLLVDASATTSIVAGVLEANLLVTVNPHDD